MPGLDCRCSRRLSISKKEEALSRRPHLLVLGLRNERKFAAFKRRHGIGAEQSFRNFGARLLPHFRTGRSQLQRPAAQVMRITCNKMDETLGEPTPSVIMRPLAENSS